MKKLALLLILALSNSFWASAKADSAITKFYFDAASKHGSADIYWYGPQWSADSNQWIPNQLRNEILNLENFSQRSYDNMNIGFDPETNKLKRLAKEIVEIHNSPCSMDQAYTNLAITTFACTFDGKPLSEREDTLNPQGTFYCKAQFNFGECK